MRVPISRILKNIIFKDKKATNEFYTLVREGKSGKIEVNGEIYNVD